MVRPSDLFSMFTLRAPSSPHLACGLNRSFFPHFCIKLIAGWAVGWLEDVGV